MEALLTLPTWSLCPAGETIRRPWVPHTLPSPLSLMAVAPVKSRLECCRPWQRAWPAESELALEGDPQGSVCKRRIENWAGRTTHPGTGADGGLPGTAPCGLGEISWPQSHLADSEPLSATVAKASQAMGGRTDTGDCLEGPQFHGRVWARHQEAAIQALAPVHIC